MQRQANPRSEATPNGDALLLARAHAELASAFEALEGIERAVSVFGSARSAPGDGDYELARAVAARLGREGFTIITGGGPGIMEAANRGARESAAASIGLVTELPVEWVNPYLDLQLRFRYFFTRKLLFVRFAVAFIIFPGGLGTLDELFELATLMQTDRVSERPIVLVGRAYWEPLIGWPATACSRAARSAPRISSS